ncbi:hypothetical protein [Anoxybacillus ayderensis]|uniref:hypothetical protein n=1 Tax=Anoxybacillus ayderensis TaxID=265546 RepID=UPI000A271D07|nr:hypothetical protein [Anoxybacillus ayderensis]OSX53657.1 hypothetical protein B7H16_10425 [Anoxybacillus ayderensis]
MTEKEIKLLEMVKDHAHMFYDGHFVLMKFTGNWRACFGTPSGDCRTQIEQMVEGKTLEECLSKLLEKPTSAYDFNY